MGWGWEALPEEVNAWGRLLRDCAVAINATLPYPHKLSFFLLKIQKEENSNKITTSKIINKSIEVNKK